MLQETLRHYYNRHQSFAPKFHLVPAIKTVCQEKEHKTEKRKMGRGIAPGRRNLQRDRYLPRSQRMLQEYVLGYLQNRQAFVHLWI